MTDYPFTALVGQEPLKTALLLNAIYPGVGGVLIRGEKGTAKSTAARSLAALLPPLAVAEGCPFRCDPAAPWPDCPHCTGTERRAAEVPVAFVELPLGATEDRLVGSLDFERALREGRRALQPGLLATAHRGVLYVDEVNLLPDHLVDVLLDAAASGVNTVEREGVSVSHPSRFLLVGTMNPEEGELRPQLLDRFALSIDVAGPREPEVRAEIVRRRLAFEAAPLAFVSRWVSEESALRARVAVARQRLGGVVLTDGVLTLITRLCCETGVDGLRADLALHKAARAHAALQGRGEVTLDDVRTAAELVLPHRRKRKPFEPPQLGREQLEERLRALPSQPETTEGAGADSEGAAPGAEGPAGPNRDGPAEQRFDAVPAPTPARIEVVSPSEAGAARGRRNPVPGGSRGPCVRAMPDARAADIAVGATVAAAVARGAWENGRLQVAPEDLHRKVRAGRTGTLLLFAVDASGSMAARRRMELVKGAVFGLLQSAYEQRDEVAVVAFRGHQAELLLDATASVEAARGALADLPTGGRTPLAHALALAGEVAVRARRAQPGRRVLLVLLSDGRANVPLPGAEGDPWRQALGAAEELASIGLPALVLDTGSGFVRLGRVEELAAALRAECLPLEEFTAERLVLELQQRQGGG